LQPSQDDWDNVSIYRGSFYVKDNYYKVWYSAAGNGKWGIGYTDFIRTVDEKFIVNDFCIKATPNLFRQNTTIKYTLSFDSKVSLGIYDITGRFKKILMDENVESGNHSFPLNTEDLNAGIYFVLIHAIPKYHVVTDYVKAAKLIILK